MTTRYRIRVHLSNDFRRTCHFFGDDGFDKAAIDGCYDGAGFQLDIAAESHAAAAETVYAICNSYPTELFCQPEHVLTVDRYRAAGNRSLSCGDLLMIENRDYVDGRDGRYGVASVGFERF